MTKGRKQFNRICSTKVKYTHKEIDALTVNQDLIQAKDVQTRNQIDMIAWDLKLQSLLKFSIS